MLLVQPNSFFGDVICLQLDLRTEGQPHWQAFEFATAWINHSAAQTILQSARSFLVGGARIRAVVGLDFASTSYDGLRSLLELEGEGGDIETYFFYDENRACTFHPKVYLFHNEEVARLFVGSNNMTGGGLATNVEASLEFFGDMCDQTISEALETLRTWQNDELSRSRRLTLGFLERLHQEGYVRTEEEIRMSRISEPRPGATSRQPVFGRSITRTGAGVRARQESGSRRTQRNSLQEVLLMRVKPRRNGRQLQMSMDVLNASFMNGATEVVSTNGSLRPIGYNIANGVRNTARFEAPEMMGMINPVARFRRGAQLGRDGANILQYEIFDAAAGGEGATILRRLEDGITNPAKTNLSELSQDETVLSKSDRTSAQWYRLDSR